MITQCDKRGDRPCAMHVAFPLHHHPDEERLLPCCKSDFKMPCDESAPYLCVCVAAQYYSIPWRQDLSNSSSSIPAALSLLLADLLNQGVVSNLTNVSVGGTVSLSQPPLQFFVCVPINPCEFLMGTRCLINYYDSSLLLSAAQLPLK